MQLRPPKFSSNKKSIRDLIVCRRNCHSNVVERGMPSLARQLNTNQSVYEIITPWFQKKKKTDPDHN